MRKLTIAYKSILRSNFHSMFFCCTYVSAYVQCTSITWMESQELRKMWWFVVIFSKKYELFEVLDFKVLSTINSFSILNSVVCLLNENTKHDWTSWFTSTSPAPSVKFFLFDDYFHLVSYCTFVVRSIKHTILQQFLCKIKLSKV